MYKNYTRKSGMPKGHVHKILLIMRLTTFILIAAIMQVSASTYGQKITLNENNATLINIFKQIRSQSGYDFLFDRELLNKIQPVSIHVKNATVEQALKLCLEPQSLTFNIEDKTVVIKEKTMMEKLSGFLSRDIIISGRVNDENGQPLPGVSVTVKGSNVARITYANGSFGLAVQDEKTVLIFSYIGYKTKEVTVSEKMTVTMEPDPAKLDEVMVIGYGTTTKRTSTGSVAKITAADLEKQPVTNVLQALAGQLPGVFVTQSNGLPGAGITVQVRGVNSLAKSNLPLYIIDGVPFLSEPINTASSSTSVLPSAEGATSPMNSINPGDIESIEVLKDADATAIYGSRGANGVVLITTKKGKSGKTKFGFNVNTGMSKVSHFVDELGTEEYLSYRKQAFANSPTILPDATNAPDLTVWDQNGYTNFQKLLLGNTAHTTDASANLSGGDARTNFYMSGTYHKETNVFLGDQGYKRAAANVSINHSSLDQKFNLGFSAIYSADQNNISTTDLATYAYNLPPNFPLYNADGSLYWYSTTANPLGYLYQTNDNKSSNLLTSLNLRYNVLPGLDVKTTLGYSHTDMDQTMIRPMSSQNPAVSTNQATASYAYNVTNNYIIEPQLTYKKKIAIGTLDALVGGTWQYKQSKMPFYVSASGFPSDDFLTNLSSASTKTISSASQDYKYASLFGRLTYNIENKYIANLTYRRDGSSRFGPANRFGNFGSAGAAYIFSEEKPVKDILPWLSFGKVRGSYGIVGSDNIGNYQYLDTYAASTYIYNTGTGLIPSRIPNSEFKWEETKKLEAAIDLGFFKDRLSFTAAFYRNRTSNQLLNYTISTQSGFGSYQSNLPATVQNSGVEFTLSSTNISTKDFKWTTTLNLTSNKNKILSFPNIEKTTYYTTYIVGNPASSIYVYQYAGINPATGLPAFTDFNNSGTITSGLAAIGRGDRTFAGTNYPKYYGGLTNNVSYKGLTLDFTFQFVKQRGRSILTSTFYPPGYMYNGSAEALRNYLALGDITALATQTTRTPAGLAAYLAYSNYTGSDAVFVDASFIRLKNVNLSYNLPSAWMSKMGVSNLRVYVQGQNLFTVTNYLGFDPESQSVGTPPLRTVTTGIQCSF